MCLSRILPYAHMLVCWDYLKNLCINLAGAQIVSSSSFSNKLEIHNGISHREIRWARVETRGRETVARERAA